MLLSQSEDEGKALENIVYMILERSLKGDDRVFYFSEAKECDFVIQRGDQIEELVQVCWELEETNIEREVGGDSCCFCRDRLPDMQDNNFQSTKNYTTR